MAINTTTRQTNAFTTGNNFPFAFKVYEVGDVKVILIQTSNGAESVYSINTHYTVTLNDDQNANPGGFVALTSSIDQATGQPFELGSGSLTGFNIVITSKVSALQQTEITNQGGFFPEVINDVLDKAVILNQQQQSIIDKTIRFPLTQTVGGLEITGDSTSRVNKVLSFDNSGNLVVSLINNSNVASDAAIDGTKVNPNFGSQNISTTGNLDVDGTTTINGILVANGNVDLGNATSDTITATGRFDSNIIPSTDGQKDLGSGAYSWRDLYIDGEAYIDHLNAVTADINGGSIDGATIGSSSASTGAFTTISASGNVDFNGNLDVDGTTFLDATYVDGTLAVDGTFVIDNVLINGSNLYTSSGDLTLDSAGGTVQVTDNFSVSGTTNLNGNVIIGNTSEDEVSFAASVSSSIHPKNGSSLDLGSQYIPWNYLYVNNLAGSAIVTNITSSSDTQVYSAKYSDERYYRKGTVDDIEASGVPWSGNDSTIATTAAIDARIRDLVDDIGGFVPIENETKFPTENPDIDNGSGTLLSVPISQNMQADTLGVLTISQTDSNGANNGNTVKITNCGSLTSFTVGLAMLVETTALSGGGFAGDSSKYQYRFHRLVPNATTITAVAAEIGTNGDITKVAEQIANGNLQDVADVTDNIEDLTPTVIGNINTIVTTQDLITDIGNAQQNAQNASTSAVDAALASGTAQGHASNALTQANNATTAKQAAEDARDLARAALDNFDDRYLGDKPTDPTEDNDNEALITGALYFNTSLNVIKVYDGAAWSQITPTDAQQTNIDAVVANETQINIVASNIDNVDTASANALSNATISTAQAAIATTQANSASSNATLVQNLSDNFHGVYLGALTGDPAGDSVGDFVNAGDIYFDTTIKKFKVFNGSSFDIVGSVSRNFFASPQVANLGVFKKYAVLTDTKAAPNSGGSFLKNFWRVRDINTEQFDDDNIASISNNQFTLQAGTYFIKASALSSNVGDNQLRIYNATDSSELARGTVCQSIIDGANFTATVQARVTITAAKAFEIQHIASQDQSIYGFGVGLVGSGNFSTLTNNEDQDFLTVEIYKESDSNTTDIILGFDLVYPAATAGNNNVDFGELPDINTTSGFADENISSGKLVSLAEGSNTTPFDFGSI